MNPRIKVVALIPTLLVAILCLFGDEGFWSFVKKTGATYLFFSVLTVLFGTLWRAARPAPVEPQKASRAKTKEKTAEAGKEEPRTAAAAP